MNQIVYYDTETDSQHAPYARLKKLGLLWEESGDTEIFNYPWSTEEGEYIQKVFSGKYVTIGFNNKNYDNLVLFNHDINVSEVDNHDVILMMKAACPGLPAYGLKFLNWYLLGDPHWPEYEMESAGYAASQVSEYLQPYLEHDLVQHRALYLYALKAIEKCNAGVCDAYMLDCRMGLPLQQMMFDGGLHLDKTKLESDVERLKKRRVQWLNRGNILSNGRVKNVNSTKQMGLYLDEEGFDLKLSKSGELSVKKKDLEDIRSSQPVAQCCYQVKDIDSSLKYFNNYLKAIAGTITDRGEGWIPTAFSISGAGTRRFTSSSLYKLNFQNPNKAAKSVQIVPPGWLGWFIDSTQVENVVHIYESKDTARRIAYEADENWSEYVWLCNQILGGDRTKEELDSIKSPLVPHWSVYKQYKTVKLMLNFGSGVELFCEITGLPKKIGTRIFREIKEACPAIDGLQDDVKERLSKNGYVQDVFGHIYTGSIDKAYKVLAYLIQGTGTASLPKAQIRANYDVSEQLNRSCSEQVSVICGTTHDENSGRIRLDIGEKMIYDTLKQFMYNMTKKFEHKFDNIPLRAKLYTTTTNAADITEIKL